MKTMTAFFLGMTALLFSTTAHAATYVVTTTEDTNDGSCIGDCSLREAIEAANQDPALDVIIIPPGCYPIQNGQLTISSDIHLIGQDPSVTILDATGSGSRILEIFPIVEAQLQNLTLTGGNSDSGGALCVRSRGSVSIKDCVLTNNHASNQGGAIYTTGDVRVKLTRCVISKNSAAASGGGIASFNPELDLKDCTLTTNQTDFFGGAVYSFGQATSFINCKFDGNSAFIGGGYYGSYLASFNHCDFRNNNAVGGGAIHAESGGTSLTIENSLFTTNCSDFGGALSLQQPNDNTTIIRNCTMSGNTATGNGGAIYAFVAQDGFNSTFIISACTIVDNSANQGDAIFCIGNKPSTLFLSNTLLVGSSSATNGCRVQSGGGNLESPGDTLDLDQLTDQVGVTDALLAPLGDNGGPTWTHVPQTGSPAIDAGVQSSCPTLDQRGFVRQDGACDIGAFEIGAIEATPDPLALDQIIPATGGTGLTSIRLFGSGFDPDLEVHLSGPGPDIPAEPTLISDDGKFARITLDLTAAAPGLWNIKLTNPGQAPLILTGKFEIEAPRSSAPTLELVGRRGVRVGRAARFTLIASNGGNVDSKFQYALLSFPATVGYELAVPAGFPSDPETDGFEHLVSVGIPPIPPDESYAIPLTLTVRATGDFEIRFGLYDPEVSTRTEKPSNAAGTPPVCWIDDPSNPNDFPPAGYIVLYANFLGAGSVAISLGDGMVTHFFPSHREDQDGLRVHPFRLEGIYEPSDIIQPPGWTQEVADSRSSDFYGRWLEGTDKYCNKKNVADCINPEDYESTDYRNSIFAPQSFPHLNCGGWVYHLWPELADLPGNFVPDIVADLYWRLYYYWRDEGVPKRYGWDIYGHGRGPDILIYQTLFGRRTITGQNSHDPNEKSGVEGVGVSRLVGTSEALGYSIQFENLQTATAPAQEVIITDQLDPTLVDLATFVLGPISFGDRVINPPSGLRDYSADVNLPGDPNDPNDPDLIVRIQASLDIDTGLALWRLTSLDPNTGLLPENPNAGFLPPNVTPPEGDGVVIFTVTPRDELSTGTDIRNSASIVFDVNPAIETPEWLNTIDATAPESEVCPIAPVQAITDFDVTWSGTDVGAGIRDFTVYVSENGGPFKVWRENTPETTAVYFGQPNTHYSFYSIAHDMVGNREEKPPFGEASTQVLGDCMAGTVNGATGTPADVLFVNGSSGDVDRVVTAFPGESLQFDFQTSPAGPATGRYLLWVWRTKTQNPTVLAARGTVIGCLSNPSPFNTGTPKPFQCVRGDLIPPIVCSGTPEFIGPATVPWTLVKGTGFAIPSTFHLQGIVEDNGALNPFGFSITNAVLLRTE